MQSSLSVDVLTNIHRHTILIETYLGGLPDEADESVVRAAFIPFGEIVNIEIPPDYENHEKHRGFSFIEYELAEDAAAAIDNMVTLQVF